MKATVSKLSVSAAAVLAFALAGVAATGARADDYCITGGAQAAHGRGYPTMEACHAASAGIGGTCSQSGGSSANSASEALAYHAGPVHAHHRHHHRHHHH